MRTSSFLAAFALAGGGIAAYGSTTISVTGQETFASSSQTWDTGSLSITIAGVTETVTYGRYSTAGSVASGLAAAISQDCKNAAFALADSQGNITVSSKNGGADPTVNGSTNSNYGITSFSFSPPSSGGGGGGGGNPPTSGGGSGNPPGGTEPPIVGGPGAPAEPGGTVLYAYQVLAGDGTSGYALNGNIDAYNDTVDGQWSAGYDTLNRITSATQASTGNSATNVPSTQYFCWIYDSFGNRMLQARAGSSFNGGCSTTSVANEHYVSASFSDPANLNRVTNVSGEAVNLNGTGSWGVGADSAGNTTQDAVNQYVYDGDGRVCATVNTVYSTWTGYLYDAEGNRVAKGTISPPAGTDPCDTTTNNFRESNEYIMGPGGVQLTELNGAGKWLHTNAFANGQLVGTYGDLTGSSTAIHFQLSDWLGTRRVQTNDQATIEVTCSSGSFGDALNCLTTSSTISDATELHFTGKERDQESGLDYFGARYYASSMGRWTSPDWAEKPEAVPYSSLDNPQSLNLYGYVLNNPLSKADPDGHCPFCEQALEEYGPAAEEAFQKYGNQAIGALSGIATAAIARGSGLLDSITGSLPSLPAGSSAMPGGQGMVTPYLMNKDAAAPDAGATPAAGNSQGGNKRTEIVQPDGRAEGDHSAAKRDPNGKITGYTTFDKDGNRKAVFRPDGKPHGGVDPPLVKEPASGKGPGSPANRARPARPEEIPQ